MDIPITIIRGGDHGATTDIVAGGQPGAMVGEVMPAQTFTDVGVIRHMQIPKQHGPILTLGTTARRAAPHFTTRNAEPQVLLVGAPTPTSTPETLSVGVARLDTIPTQEWWAEPELDMRGIYTVVKGPPAAEGSLTTPKLAAASRLVPIMFMAEKTDRSTAITVRMAVGRRTAGVDGRLQASRK